MSVTSKTVRVLLVDDQESFRSAARMVIDMVDEFELVGEAESGEEATELAEASSPDLVLMDINLPGFDGWEATRRILDKNSDVRVIVISTYEGKEYESRARNAGAVAFVPKSDFDPETLIQIWQQSSKA